jgi:hypothetical protein
VTVALIEVQRHNIRKEIEVQALTQRGTTPQTSPEQPPAEPLGPDDLLTYAEAAAFLRCQPRTVKRYVRDGEAHLGSHSPSTLQRRGGG